MTITTTTITIVEGNIWEREEHAIYGIEKLVRFQ